MTKITFFAFGIFTEINIAKPKVNIHSNIKILVLDLIYFIENHSKQ